MRKQLILMSMVLATMTAFGQKEALKSAEKALKLNDFTTAIQVLQDAEGSIAGADQKTTAKYYYLKSKALYKNGAADIDVNQSSSAFWDLLNYERETKKLKYSSEVEKMINDLINRVGTDAANSYNSAIETKDPVDYKAAADGYHQLYMLNPADTVSMDNAALLYFFAKEHQKSLNLYSKLLDLGYTGIATIYKATSKDDGQEIVYGDKKRMDLDVKLGIVENPRTELKESRREIIYKNLAQNHSALDNTETALEYIAKGREEYPQSYALLIDEANIYFKLGENELFKQKLEEAIDLNPTEPSLHYNVGVMNMEQNKIDEAIKCFERAIELKPDYSDAYNNIGAAIIEKADPIIEEMNKSLTDFDKYDRLQAEQFEIYKQAVPYYEKAYKFNNSSINVVQTLMGLYENLEMTEKYEELRAVYEKLKQ